MDGSGIFRHDGSFYPVQMKLFKHKLNTKSKSFAGVSFVPVCRGKAIAGLTGIVSRTVDIAEADGAYDFVRIFHAEYIEADEAVL
jgi:hypothetical protein